MQTYIGIIDLGLGNINSIRNAFRYLGYDSLVIKEPSNISLRHLILPGVGNFGQASNSLTDDWRVFLYDHVKKGDYLLGICLGMQLLFRSSEESNGKGLAFFNEDIKSLNINNKDLILPRIGWRLVKYPKNYKGKIGYPGQITKYYFVHSYGFINSNFLNKDNYQIVEEVEDNLNVAASIEKDNILGMQYHPEKSSFFGLNTLKNYIIQNK